MSISYSKKKKAQRRALDAENPERKNVRRMIRAGLMPRRAFEKGKFNGKEMPIMRTVPGSRQTPLNAKVKTTTVRRFIRTWATFDVFQSLTKKEAK